MPNKHAECKRQFTHTSRAWYSKTSLAHADYKDEVTIGMYHPEGGTTGEFSIRWFDLGGKTIPRLHAYDDSWNALSTQFIDLIHALGELNDSEPNPETICNVLISLGIKDATPTVSPYPETQIATCPNCGKPY